MEIEWRGYRGHPEELEDVGRLMAPPPTFPPPPQPLSLLI